MDERQLSLLWRTQRLDPTHLRTTDGQQVEVVYRGRPHRSTGPDFQGAIVVVGGEVRRGDVELHVRSSSWAGHRHHRDHRYDQVILHVVLQADAGFEARTSAGALVPCLPLDRALSLAEAQLLPKEESSCRGRVAGLTDAELGQRLDALGWVRLADRSAALAAEAALEGFEQTLYARFLDALGYSQNRAPGRELASRLRVDRLYALAHRRPTEEAALICRALLFGVAGLLPSQRTLAVQLDWASEQESDELEAVWRSYGDEWAAEAMRADAWTLSVRPLNAPPRRLAGLAAYLSRHLSTGLVEGLLAPLQALTPRLGARRLVESLVLGAPDSYWGGYSDFGRPLPGSSAPTLVGTGRAREVAASVALPLALAWAEASHDEGLAERVRAVHASLPSLAANEATSWMIDEVIGRDRRRLVASARRQQGLYHLFRVACDQRLCDRCPL